MYLVDGRGFSTTTTTLVEYFLKESQMEAGQSRWRVKKYIYIYIKERENYPFVVDTLPQLWGRGKRRPGQEDGDTCSRDFHTLSAAFAQ